MSFSLRDLTAPIVAAPMAGGPSTPELAAAVSNAGGLGFLPGGYLTGQRLAEDVAAARALTSGPLGVNLFVPQADNADPVELDAYRTAVREFGRRYGVEPGEARWADDDWIAKIEVVLDVRPELVSFTFALPDRAVLRRLRQAGIATAMTVTSVDEARLATGFDVLVVQGPAAGGHRGTLDPLAQPSRQPLTELLAAVTGAVDIPVVAAGGICDARAAADAVRAGARGVQVGTALLLAEEAGTNAVHRAALADPRFTDTVVTRSISGRYARGLVNEFVSRFDALAPLAYPQLHYMISPIRRAAVAAGDPDGASLWAGTGFASARPASAADIVAGLVG